MSDDPIGDGIVEGLDRKLAEIEAVGAAFNKASAALNDLGQEVLVSAQRVDGDDERVFHLLMMGRRLAGIATDLGKEAEAWLKGALSS